VEIESRERGGVATRGKEAGAAKSVAAKRFAWNASISASPMCPVRACGGAWQRAQEHKDYGPLDLDSGSPEHRISWRLLGSL
jgi:hypothetical protein